MPDVGPAVVLRPVCVALTEAKLIPIGMILAIGAVLRPRARAGPTCHGAWTVPAIAGACKVLPAEFADAGPICGLIVVLRTGNALVLLRTEACLTMAIANTVILLTA